MKVSEAIETGKLDFEDIVAFMDGELGKWEDVQQSMNDLTGFEKTTIDINEDWDGDSIMDAELIDSGF